MYYYHLDGGASKTLWIAIASVIVIVLTVVLIIVLAFRKSLPPGTQYAKDVFKSKLIGSKDLIKKTDYTLNPCKFGSQNLCDDCWHKGIIYTYSYDGDKYGNNSTYLIEIKKKGNEEINECPLKVGDNIIWKGRMGSENIAKINDITDKEDRFFLHIGPGTDEQFKNSVVTSNVPNQECLDKEGACKCNVKNPEGKISSQGYEKFLFLPEDNVSNLYLYYKK